MKENNNPDVCPCCGQKIPEKPKRYLFKEQWEEALLSKKLDLCREFPECELTTFLKQNREECKRVPFSLLEWIRNTKPMVNCTDFTVQLAQRVEHLESLLREKGVEV